MRGQVKHGGLLDDAVERLYQAFAGQGPPTRLYASPLRDSEAILRALRSAPLRVLGGEQVLPYAGWAMTTVDGPDTYRHFLPRILELALDNPPHVGAEPDVIAGKLDHRGMEELAGGTAAGSPHGFPGSLGVGFGPGPSGVGRGAMAGRPRRSGRRGGRAGCMATLTFAPRGGTSRIARMPRAETAAERCRRWQPRVLERRRAGRTGGGDSLDAQRGRTAMVERRRGRGGIRRPLDVRNRLVAERGALNPML